MSALPPKRTSGYGWFNAHQRTSLSVGWLVNAIAQASRSLAEKRETL